MQKAYVTLNAAPAAASGWSTSTWVFVFFGAAVAVGGLTAGGIVLAVAVSSNVDTPSMPPSPPLAPSPTFPPFAPLEAGSVVVDTPATLVSGNLVVEGEVADVDRVALGASLQAPLSCFTPACILQLHLSAGSVLVRVDAVVVDGSSSAVEAAAKVFFAQPPAAISSVTNMTVTEQPSAPTVVQAVVPVAFQPPPPSPPVSPPPYEPGMAPEWTVRNHGSCGALVQTIEECKQAFEFAKFNSQPGLDVFDTNLEPEDDSNKQRRARDPPGCFAEVSKPLGNKLYYNTDGLNVGVCGPDDLCLCAGRTSPEAPPPPAPPAWPDTLALAITSGFSHCELTTHASFGGNCITDGADDYGPMETCEMHVNSDIELYSVTLQAEDGYDFMTLDEVDVFGTSHHRPMPSLSAFLNGDPGLLASAGSKLKWKSDDTGQFPGWIVCWRAATAQAASASISIVPPAPPKQPPKED